MSELVPQQVVAGAVQQSATQQSSSSSSKSFSYSSSQSSSSSSSTKVVKQSTTTVKSSSSGSSTVQSSSSTRSSGISIKSSGQSYSDQIAGELGIDVSKELDRLRLCMDSEMSNIHRDMFRLMPGSPTAPVQPITAGDAVSTSTMTTTTSQQQLTGGDLGSFLVKMDPDAIRSCIDKAHDDRVKLNFDVQEFDSETINIKTVGNKIEVHAMKKSKKGDEERSEEFTRVYEMPTQNDVDPSKVTSSIYKDGVLTIELPVADALGDVTQ